MQKFLLNDKVITQMHMKTVDLKQRTKYIKKYDMPYQKYKKVDQSNDISNLLAKKKNMFKFSNDQPNNQNSKKTKNLFSTLNIQGLLSNQHKNGQQNHVSIKNQCFTLRGIKKSIKQLNDYKKQGMQRTCSLVSFNRSLVQQGTHYDFNVDIKFKRSPRCFISPQSHRQKKINLKIKQNIDVNFQGQTKNKHKDSETTINIKKIVDRQIQDLMRMRKALCRTAPTNYSKKKCENIKLNQQALTDDEIKRVQVKIYSDMRQNRQKTLKRNNQNNSINIEKNKPFNSVQINKNTIKLLKKYKFYNLVYFNKFVSKE